MLVANFYQGFIQNKRNSIKKNCKFLLRKYKKKKKNLIKNEKIEKNFSKN